MSARVRPERSSPRSSAGSRHVAQVALCREAVDQESVADFSCDLGHELTDAGDEHLRRSVGIRPGLNIGVISVCCVELAPERELRPFVPCRPDRPHREDVLAHSRCRVRPRHRESLLDVRLYLRAEPEHEPALRVELQVVRHRRHRSSGLRANATAIPVPSSRLLGVLRSEQQREERVMAGLGAPDSRVPGLLGPLSQSRRRLSRRIRCLRRPSQGAP